MGLFQSLGGKLGTSYIVQGFLKLGKILNDKVQESYFYCVIIKDISNKGKGSMFGTFLVSIVNGILKFFSRLWHQWKIGSVFVQTLNRNVDFVDSNIMLAIRTVGVFFLITFFVIRTFLFGLSIKLLALIIGAVLALIVICQLDLVCIYRYSFVAKILGRIKNSLVWSDLND
jgi:hypothetical protein